MLVQVQTYKNVVGEDEMDADDSIDDITIPDEVKDYNKKRYFDDEDETVDSKETVVSSEAVDESKDAVEDEDDLDVDEDDDDDGDDDEEDEGEYYDIDTELAFEEVSRGKETVSFEV